MYIGRVIAKQRLGKLSKSASHYPQIWHVNLETLSIYRCLSLWKLRQNKRKILQFDEKCFLFTNFWITSENNFQKSFKLRLVSTYTENRLKKKQYHLWFDEKNLGWTHFYLTEKLRLHFFKDGTAWFFLVKCK